MRPMQPDDVYRLAAAGDPRVSPDGRTIAFVVSTVDPGSHEARSAVWSVPADGASAPRRLTFGGSRDANPRWSPDGRWLAFTSARGDDPAQLFVLPVDGPGESRHLTSLPEAVEQSIRGAEPAYDLLGARGKLGVNYANHAHAFTADDWSALLDFADKHLLGKPVDRRFDRFPPAPATAPRDR